MVTYSTFAFYFGLVFGLTFGVLTTLWIQSKINKHSKIIPLQVLKEPTAGVTEYNMTRIK